MNTSSERLSAVGLAVALGLFLSACGGGDAEAGGEPGGAPPSAEVSPEAGGDGGESESAESSESASPTPVPASSEGPAQNWPEPEIPDAMYEESEEGALAALQYWFEVDLYMQLTGESEPFEHASDVDCQICSGRIGQFEKLYLEDEGWHVADGAVVEDEIVSSVSAAREVSIIFTIHEGPFVEFSVDGQEQASGGEERLSGVEAVLGFDRSRWRVTELYFPDDPGVEN